jgi:hypothetical protein
MQFELFVEPNEEEFVRKHANVIRQKLSTSLTLLLQELHADDLKRIPIGRGLDGAAVVEMATKKEKAAAEHAATFVQPPEEVERNRQFASEARAARKALRW